MRPVIERYSPFDSDARIELGLGDPLEDIGDMADVITQIGDHLTNDEIRQKLDMAPHEDEEIGESYRTPADVEAPEDEGGGMEGLFREARALAVPDSAIPIDSRSEAPEGAQIVTGDRGGLYYLPAGEGGESDNGATVDVTEPPEGGFDDSQVLENMEQLTPTAEDVDAGEVNPENVAQMSESLPNDREESRLWAEFENGDVPNKGGIIATGDTVGVMTDIANPEDFPDIDFVVTTPDGEDTIDSNDVTHTFDETGASLDEPEPEAERTLPERRDANELREEITERVNTTDEATELLDNLESPQELRSFDNWKAFHDITDSDIVDGDRDPPDLDMNTDDAQLAQEATQTLVEMRERGMLSDNLSKIGVTQHSLDVPEGAQGAFNPGVRDISGEIVKSTENRSPEVFIRENSVGDWGGMQDHVPVDIDDVSHTEYAMYHEMGHHQHYENMIKNNGQDIEDLESDELNKELKEELRPVKDEITEEFSALDAEQPMEFAADMYASLAVGEDFSDELLEAYSGIGGVMP